MHAQENMEFLYPVAQIDNDSLLVLHQKSFDDIELWRWNKNEKIAFKELNSIFLPSFVKLLPSKQACSFIDRGRIKIKYFAKRTPRTIDLYEPISAISSINWIDEELFYFVGKHEDHFGIFLCDIADHKCTISCLSNLNNACDYLYPQKINDFLFCIIKDQDGQYAICKLSWDPKVYKHELHIAMQTRHANFEHTQNISFENSPEIVLFSSLTPLCFLQMQDENTGFCLKFTMQNPTSQLFSFACCKLEKRLDASWSLETLFDFQLPKNLLIGSESEKIYESIYPFLPIYTKDCIFFVDLDQELKTCQILRYERKYGFIEKITQNSIRSLNINTHFFAPCIVNDSIYTGISSPVIELRPSKKASLMQADQITGAFQCQLPEIKL